MDEDLKNQLTTKIRRGVSARASKFLDDYFDVDPAVLGAHYLLEEFLDGNVDLIRFAGSISQPTSQQPSRLFVKIVLPREAPVPTLAALDYLEAIGAAIPRRYRDPWATHCRKLITFTLFPVGEDPLAKE